MHFLLKRKDGILYFNGHVAYDLPMTPKIILSSKWQYGISKPELTPVLSTKLRGANQRYSDPTWFGGPISVSLTKKCFDEGLAIHFNFANINLSTIYICIKTYLSCCLSDMSDQNRRYIGIDISAYIQIFGNENTHSREYVIHGSKID